MVATIIPLIPRPKPGMSESHRFQEPVFDPNRHLALTPPNRIIRFTDPDIETGGEGGFVLTAPFRLLSAEGTAAAMEAAGHSTAFLTDLFRCREVAEFIGWLAGTSLIAMPSLAKNRENRQPGAATWHLGQRDFTCFLGLAAPDRSDTGCLDWFRGRSAVGAELLKSVGDIPDQYKGSQPLPPAGFAVLARTGRLLHRIRGNADAVVTAGYCPETSAGLSRNGFAGCGDDPDRAMIEWMRHKALLSHRKLGRLLNALDPSDPALDRRTLAHHLFAALADAQEAVEALCSESEGLDIYYES
jgi:hypothetical protein